MAFDIKTTADDLRNEARALREKAIKLEQAAEVLDPAPSQKALLMSHRAVITTTEKSFSELTVVKGAELLLREAGKPLSREELYNALKKRGSDVTTVVNLVSGLSRAKDRFVSLGKSMWDLKGRALAHADADFLR